MSPPTTFTSPSKHHGSQGCQEPGRAPGNLFFWGPHDSVSSSWGPGGGGRAQTQVMQSIFMRDTSKCEGHLSHVQGGVCVAWCLSWQAAGLISPIQVAALEQYQWRQQEGRGGGTGQGAAMARRGLRRQGAMAVSWHKPHVDSLSERDTNGLTAASTAHCPLPPATGGKGVQLGSTALSPQGVSRCSPGFWPG